MDLENFEGNAQALRSILKLPFSDSEFGMNLTAAVINTLIKYPCCSKDIDDKAENIQYHKWGSFRLMRNWYKEYAGRPELWLLEAMYVIR